MTLSDCLDYCKTELDKAGLWFGHGTDNVHDEAAWLILAAMHRPADAALPAEDLELEPNQEARIRELLLLRVKTRKPLAYLLGEAWFCGLRFEVTPDVLVPRSPIAELVEAGFRPWVEPERVTKILDLCTGCGAIAIATAIQLPWAQVDASDISPAALGIAERNRVLHGMGNRVALIESDLYAGLAGRKYDLVVTNPPYVSMGQFDHLPGEYHAEPVLGLVSAGGGLQIPLRILRDSPTHLANGGVLVCEVGENAAALQDLLPQVPLTWIEFEHGGEGVFTIGREELLSHRRAVDDALEGLRNVV